MGVSFCSIFFATVARRRSTHLSADRWRCLALSVASEPLDHTQVPRLRSHSRVLTALESFGPKLEDLPPPPPTVKVGSRHLVASAPAAKMPIGRLPERRSILRLPLLVGDQTHCQEAEALDPSPACLSKPRTSLNEAELKDLDDSLPSARVNFSFSDCPERTNSIACFHVHIFTDIEKRDAK